MMRLGGGVCKVGTQSKVDKRNELNMKWLAEGFVEVFQCYYKSKLTVKSGLGST